MNKIYLTFILMVTLLFACDTSKNSTSSQQPQQVQQPEQQMANDQRQDSKGKSLKNGAPQAQMQQVAPKRMSAKTAEIQTSGTKTTIDSIK